MPKLSRIKLTKRTVEAAVPPQSGDRFVWDSEIRGFGLRVYASGRRLFLFQYQAPATAATRRLALGEFPAITVEQARSLAHRASGQIAEGRDPKGDDTDQLQRRTIAEVFPEYLAERSAKVALRTAGEWTRVWKKDLETGIREGSCVGPGRSHRGTLAQRATRGSGGRQSCGGDAADVLQLG